MQTSKHASAFKIHCPLCQRALSGAYINKRSELGFCTECNEVFSISEHLKAQATDAPPASLLSDRAGTHQASSADQKPKADRVVSAWRTQRTQARSEAAVLGRDNQKAGASGGQHLHDKNPSSQQSPLFKPVSHDDVAVHQHSDETDEAALSASQHDAYDNAQEPYVSPDFPRDPLPSNTVLKEAAGDSITISTKTRSGWALLFIPTTLALLAWVFSGAATLFLERWGQAGIALNILLAVIAILSVPMCLMMVVGRFEVKLICGRGTIFAGIGNVGLIQRFFLDEVGGIGEFASLLGRWMYVGIRINANEESIKCGRFLNEEKRYFFINCLNDLKAMQIRKREEHSKLDRRKLRRPRAKKTGASSILNPGSRYGRIFEKE